LPSREQRGEHVQVSGLGHVHVVPAEEHVTGDGPRRQLRPGERQARSAQSSRVS
jgi:hypothetical protein